MRRPSEQGRHLGFSFAHGACMTTQNTPGAIDPELLEILRCPVTRSRLRPEGDFLVAEVGGLAYPVRDGIPVMLAEEARLPPRIASLDELRQRYQDQIGAA